MASNPDVLLPEAIKGFELYPSARPKKIELFRAIVNDPEFPYFLRNDAYQMDALQHLIVNGHRRLDNFIPDIVGGIIMTVDPVTGVRRPPMPHEVSYAKGQLIRAVNRVILSKMNPKLLARNVLSLKRTFGSPYTSTSTPQIPENAVSQIERALSGKEPTATAENARAGRTYSAMTRATMNALRNNYRRTINERTRKRKARKSRKSRK